MNLVSAKQKAPRRRSDPDPALSAPFRVLFGGADGRTFLGGGATLDEAMTDAGHRASLSDSPPPWWGMHKMEFMRESDVEDAVARGALLPAAPASEGVSADVSADPEAGVEVGDGDNVVVMQDAAVDAVDSLLSTPPSGGGGS